MESGVPLFCNSAWSVVQPAQNTPNHAGTVPSKEAEASYISSQFLNMWEQEDDRIISVPRTFTLSPAAKDGEKAEKVLFDILKEAGSNIPGLRMVMFSGLRCTAVGDTGSEEKLIIREIDSSVYLEYQGKRYASFFETKCCKDETGLKQHRKKSTGQLKKVTLQIYEQILIFSVIAC